MYRKEKDFWEFGQRAAITLPKVGFATTTDIDKSALHPPDKQDIAPRMALEVERCAGAVRARYFPLLLNLSWPTFSSTDFSDSAFQ